MHRVILFECPDKAFDLTDLARFGEVTHLFNNTKDRLVPHPFRHEQFCKLIMEKLQAMSFNPDKDYIALVGRTTKFLYLALQVVAEYRRAKLLQYNATNGTYFVQHIGALNGEASSCSRLPSSTNDEALSRDSADASSAVHSAD